MTKRKTKAKTAARKRSTPRQRVRTKPKPKAAAPAADPTQINGTTATTSGAEFVKAVPTDAEAATRFGLPPDYATRGPIERERLALEALDRLGQKHDELWERYRRDLAQARAETRVMEARLGRLWDAFHFAHDQIGDVTAKLVNVTDLSGVDRLHSQRTARSHRLPHLEEF
jgi:hypothetical protein